MTVLRVCVCVSVCVCVCKWVGLGLSEFSVFGFLDPQGFEIPG